MSSSILDQLEAKPVPKKQQQIRILIPKKGQVAIKAAIVDLRSEGYNRQELKNKLHSVGSEFRSDRKQDISKSFRRRKQKY